MYTRNRFSRQRNGYVIVWFALAMTVLLGMVGLVIDGGLLLAWHRQTQNAADAAATAAAMHLLKGQTIGNATTTARTFVANNGIDGATVVVNSPPQSGPYVSGGSGTYVEVIVTHDVDMFLAPILPTIGASQQVQARAVAGFEAVAGGEGVMALDPRATPGLEVAGQGVIRVDGRVVVNSEGGGIDEFGNTVNNNNGVAASAGQPNSPNGIYAREIDIVGGVDVPALFKPYDPADPSPLDAGQVPEPDPLINLETPTTANGVDPTSRGDVKVSNTNVLGMGTDAAGQNYESVTGGEVVGDGHVTIPGEVVLHPGVYDQIEITGGTVYFVPGIYVMSPPGNTNIVLKITGGTVLVDKSMFYMTGDTYDPVTGEPVVDGSNPPPAAESPAPNFGKVEINSDVEMTPIDTDNVVYSSMYGGAPPISDEFDGMLFFQRRANEETVKIVGNSANAGLHGTLYAKWAQFDISGQGNYDAQFIVGSIAATGQADITIRGGGDQVGKANLIFLVE